MTRRRAIRGLKTRAPLRDDAEYGLALSELQGLGHAALGTPATTGLQDLVDCILDYESAQALTLARVSASADRLSLEARHQGPTEPGGPE